MECGVPVCSPAWVVSAETAGCYERAGPATYILWETQVSNLTKAAAHTPLLCKLELPQVAGVMS